MYRQGEVVPAAPGTPFLENMPEKMHRTQCFCACSPGDRLCVFSIEHAVNMVKTASGREGGDFEKILSKGECHLKMMRIYNVREDAGYPLDS